MDLASFHDMPDLLRRQKSMKYHPVCYAKLFRLTLKAFFHLPASCHMDLKICIDALFPDLLKMLP